MSRETWTDIYGNTFTQEDYKRRVGRPRKLPPKNPNAPHKPTGFAPLPPKPKPVTFNTADIGNRYYMLNFIKGQAEAGLRDERGVRVLAYRNKGDDYDGTSGEALSAMYNMAMNNMRRQKQGVLRTNYPDVEALQDAIINYWAYLDDANKNGIALIPDLEGICSFLGISRETFRKWERDNFMGFGDTLTQVRNDIAACKKQLGLQNKIPAIVMAMDFNNNHGYVQKQEVQLTPTNPLGEATKTPELAAKYMDLIEGEYEEVEEDELETSNS